MNKTPPPPPPQKPTNLHQENWLIGQTVGVAVIVLALLMCLLLCALFAAASYTLLASGEGSEVTAQVQGAGESLGKGSVGTPGEGVRENESELGNPQTEGKRDPITRESDDNKRAEDTSELSDPERSGTDAKEYPELDSDDRSSPAPLEESSHESQSEAESLATSEEGQKAAQEEKEAQDVPPVAAPRMLNSGTGGDSANARVILSKDFQNHLAALRDDGLEVALLFDATGSMNAQIEIVKQHLRKIVGTVHSLVPMAAFTVAVYRDFDSIPVEGIKLTTNAEQIDRFVNEVRLIGGRDFPESVGSGLEWVTQQNSFSDDSSRIQIIVGDAPPHTHEMKRCISMIREHVRNGKSRVYTLTCNSNFVIPEFRTLAKAGDGVALTIDRAAIVTELLVLSLGAEYRDEIKQLLLN